MKKFSIFILAILSICFHIEAATPYKPFIIKVKDSVTGKGIPLVEVKTENKISHYTDINGEVAFYEPGLMNTEVYFHVKSTDYDRDADWFGYRGKSFNTIENGYGEISVNLIETGKSSYWNLNEGTGTTAQDWIHGNTATLVNGVTWLNGGGVTQTASDDAIRFDGSNDYMKLPRLVQDDFSIAFYIKTTQYGSSGTQWFNGKGIIDAEVGGVTNDFGISLVNSKICFGVGNPDRSIFSTSTINDGQWHFIVATRNGNNGEIALYVDSFKEASTFGNTNDLNAPAELHVGKILAGGNYFAGTLDEIAIFEKTLSPQEVYTMYNQAFIPASRTIEPFVIKIKDSETNRGVPLVSLKMDSGLEYITDSNGVVAIYEPDLMNRNLSFEVFSHGYKTPDQGGFTCDVTPNGISEFSIERINAAERMYRITGQGIYHHSTLAGLDVPLLKPNLNSKVVGQDTVAMTEYKGKYHWLWGDTSRAAYPLGNFQTSGATSKMPESGGLPSDEGVDLTYYVNNDGFSKQMFPRNDANLVWMNTMCTVDDSPNENLIASYSAMRSDSPDENGFAVFNDQIQEWETLVIYKDYHNIQPHGHGYRHTDGYIYVSQNFPTIRFRATYNGAKNPLYYEGFTCLQQGTKFNGSSSLIDRDNQGKIIWAWKRNTSTLGDDKWNELINAGLVTKDEEWNRFYDIQTGKHVYNAGGAVSYNTFRNCWTMIFQQSWGTSFAGETWYAEAPSPEGPWNSAIKIISHDNYTFYNPQSHPELSKDNQRYLYLEGTYVTTYSGNPNPTPRYDYNQVMYRLDLDSPKIKTYYSKTRKGSIYREWWDNVNGLNVSDLTNNPNFPQNPSGTSKLLTFEEPRDFKENFGSRIQGYIYPPQTGYYTFWIAGDDSCQLWLSTDGTPENKRMIANTPAWTDFRKWDAFPSNQKSISIHLNAQNKYYIEALHKEDVLGDHLSVAWQGPGFTREIIDGKYLSPWPNGTYGDFTYDKNINTMDLNNLTNLWLEEDCTLTAEYDINGDCHINFYEISAIANNWLKNN